MTKLKKYQVCVIRTEVKRYYQTVNAFNSDRAETLARRQLEANDWTCEVKGHRGNCIDAEEDYIVQEIQD